METYIDSDEEDTKGNAWSATISNERNAQLVVSRMMKHLTDVHLSKNRQRL